MAVTSSAGPDTVVDPNDTVVDPNAPPVSWHTCFRFLGIDPPKLFSSREQHTSRADGDRPVGAVDFPRQRRAAAAAAAADPAR
jgi:hypothetical protein